VPDLRHLPPSSTRIRTLGCHVDNVTLHEATARVVSWLVECERAHRLEFPSQPCRYVVTPNLDHAVLLKENEALQKAYDAAALILADGMPLVWASRILRTPLQERVAGSDLVPAVLLAAAPGTKVFFLGASDESAAKAVQNVQRRHSQLDLVGRLSPPFGFEKDPAWSVTIVEEIVASQASLIVVGFGAPKQELWVHAHHHRLPNTVALCAGATIDFLAGTVARAPSWAQKSGLEWVHRLLSDPGRLGRRYGKDLLALPGLLFNDFRHGRQQH
jgi:N-acetylglucosaminyldiphosphoundecaprenol N-acetyl-beta-D-mannosaminyltransferase